MNDQSRNLRSVLVDAASCTSGTLGIAVCIASATLNRAQIYFGRPLRLFVGNHKIHPGSILVVFQEACLHCRSTVLSQCYIQHALCLHQRSTASLLRNRTHEPSRTAQADGQASVHSLLRCSAHSPPFTKLLAHCALIARLPTNARLLDRDDQDKPLDSVW